jgi:hypothetical protein
MKSGFKIEFRVIKKEGSAVTVFSPSVLSAIISCPLSLSLIVRSLSQVLVVLSLTIGLLPLALASHHIILGLGGP